MSNSNAVATTWSGAEQLSKLLSLADAHSTTWSEADLPAMLRHQFAAPLAIDLGRLPVLTASAAQNRPKPATASPPEKIISFADLLFHPCPAEELLRAAKEFFKLRTRECEKHSPDWQVAYYCYLLCIVAAEAQGLRLSKLKPEDLRKGVNWALERSWGDDRSRRLFGKGNL